MGKVTQLAEVDVSLLKPYEKNAKIHGDEQISKLCESIREYGFLSPILIDGEMNVIAGHGRLMAAKKLGMKTVPCQQVEGLSDDQRRAYILADNRLNEFSEWNLKAVAGEISSLKLEPAKVQFMEFQLDSFGSRKAEPKAGKTGSTGNAKGGTGAGAEGTEDAEPGTGDGAEGTEDAEPGTGDGEESSGEESKGKAWSTQEKRCDMRLAITARVKNGRWYTALHAVSKEGKTLVEIKNDKKCERQLVSELTDYIIGSMGKNLAGTGWAMITTGRRRHREGYHFATEVARKAAKKLKIPFYEGAIQIGNSDRLKPAMELTVRPEEKNLILFDDIITTGTTAGKTAELMESEGYTVITVIGIRNQ